MHRRCDRFGNVVHRGEAVGIDGVVIVADAAIQDHHILPVGAVHYVDAIGVDLDLGRPPDQADRTGRQVSGLRIEHADTGDRVADQHTILRFNGQSGIGIDAGALTRDLDTTQERMFPVVGVELVGRFGLVRRHVRDLIAALRVGGQRRQFEGGFDDRTLRQRADVVVG